MNAILYFCIALGLLVSVCFWFKYHQSIRNKRAAIMGCCLVPLMAGIATGMLIRGEDGKIHFAIGSLSMLEYIMLITAVLQPLMFVYCAVRKNPSGGPVK